MRELFELMNDRNAKMSYLSSLLKIPGNLQNVGQNMSYDFVYFFNLEP